MLYRLMKGSQIYFIWGMFFSGIISLVYFVFPEDAMGQAFDELIPFDGFEWFALAVFIIALIGFISVSRK